MRTLPSIGTRLLVLIFTFGSLIAAVAAQVNVTTYHYDNSRTGQNTQETILSPSNVNSNQFGKLFSVPVDGDVYAQPLYVANVQVAGTVHNVLYVATEHDSLYAIDADSGAQLWQQSFIDLSSGITPVSSTDVSCPNITPEIGITSTPVIDTVSGTIYLVTKAKENGVFVQRLHALDIATHLEKFGGPVVIAATVSGTGQGGKTVSFDPLRNLNRPGLLLESGHLVIGWGSHCDYGIYDGWVMSYNALTLTQEAALSMAPNGSEAAVWMAGAGAAADSSGNIFLATGNGTYDGSAAMDFGDSIVKLGPPGNGTFPVTDWFTPFNQGSLSTGDVDLGSGGVLLLPDLPPGFSQPHLLVHMGKEGRIYLVNRDNMGQYCSGCVNTDIQIVQEIPGASNGIWGAPAYWNGYLYWVSGNDDGTSDTLKAFSFNANSSGLLSTSPTSQSQQAFVYVTGPPTISANGNANGVLWLLDNTIYATNQVLYAFDASNVANMLYNSNQAANNRDVPGGVVRFTTPVVANGKLYVGSHAAVSAYGLLSSTAATPTFSPAPGTYSTPQTVSLSDTTSGAVIHCTTDGSTPTASSAVCTSVSVSATTTIEAIAVASGYTNSAVAIGTYTINAAAATPTFSPAPGTYSTPQTVSLSDTTSGAVIHCTTDGSTPTASSAVCTSVSVSATTTIEAIAVASGYTNSAVAIGTYTINAAAATPTFSPAPGTYSTPQTVSLSDTTSGAVIHCTTDGSTPTASSAVCTSVSVSATTTIKAIAVASGYTNSAVAIGSYTIGTTSINYGTGFTSSGLQLNGKSILNGSRLRLTDGGASEASSAFFTTAVNVQSFTTDFSFQLTNPNGDGIAFVIQNNSIKASGPSGGGLGYGFTPPWSSMSKSVAVKFDLYSNAGEGVDSTGLYTGGAYPSVPALDMTSSGVNLHSGDVFNVHMSYDGTTLSMSITDANNAALRYNTSWTINIPSTVGGNTAWVGFTAGTGGATAIQEILTWTYAVSGFSTAATPTFSPAPGTYSTPQTVSLSDTTSGAVIHCTTDGSTPTASSAVCTSVSVSATTTIEAIAVASGYTNSAVAIGTYTINATAATPTFSPAPGTYSTPQTVSLSDTTSGAVIHCTTDGSTPTASSAVCTSVSVSATTTIEAIAVASGYTNSAVAIGTYTINAAAATPTFSPAPGTYSTPQTVSLSDTTSGAVIHCTTDGSTPTASSAVCTSVSVSATTTIEAIAVASGYTNSAVAIGTYTINAAAATPTFSPAPGTYSTPQTVSLSDTTSGAVIHCTTDGSTPTASSAVCTSVSVSATTTIKAIAVASGYTNSAVAIGSYTIGTTSINYGTGFTSSGLQLNGKSILNGSRLRLTDGGASEASSAFFTTAVNVQSFTTDFSFQLTNPNGDGIAFVIQNNSIKASGPSGGGLGYGFTPPWSSMSKSVAVKFDLYSNAGEGVDSTGLYTGGAYPSVPALDMTSSGVNLHSGDVFNVHMSYDGTTLSMSITDANNAALRYNTSWTINIPSTVGGNTAWVGFTAGTGGATAIQEILTWTY